MKYLKTATFAAILFFSITNLTIGDEKHNRRIRDAVDKSIRLIEMSATEYLNHRECFSCHHQAMPIIALQYVKENGFKIDQKKLQAQVDHTFKHFKKNTKKYKEGQGTGGQVDTAGYGLWALNAAATPSDDFTKAVVTYLSKRDKKREFWRRSSERPPSEASNFTATFVAVKTISNYGTAEQKTEATEKLEKVKKWWSKTETRDTEDLVFKLLLARELQLEKKKSKPLVDILLKMQNDDGGWSQTEKLQSDAYATGTVMYCLYELGYLRASDNAYQKGIRYLLDSQNDDGSWHVKSRSSPFQEYFESGFPHKKDQFISITASCWAIMALSAK